MIASLVKELAANGVSLWIEAGRLRYNSPGGLPSETMEKLRTQKTDLLAYLSSVEATVPRNDTAPIGAPASLQALPPVWREDLVKACSVAKRNGYSLEQARDFYQQAYPTLTNEQFEAAWKTAGSELAEDLGGDLAQICAPLLPPPADRVSFLRQHATPEELSLLGGLSIVELCERVQARLDGELAQRERMEEFFATWPRYIEAIQWRFKKLRWSKAQICAYFAAYQPDITAAYIDYALTIDPGHLLSLTYQSESQQAGHNKTLNAGEVQDTRPAIEDQENETYFFDLPPLWTP